VPSSSSHRVKTFDWNQEEHAVVLVYAMHAYYCSNRVHLVGVCGGVTLKEESAEDLLKVSNICFYVCNDEADSFWCLYHLLQSRQKHSGQVLGGVPGPQRGSGISYQLGLLSQLLRARELRLFRHLDENRVAVEHLAIGFVSFRGDWPRWMKTFFMGYLPRDCVVRLCQVALTLRILDKVIGRSPDFAPCAALVVLQTLKHDLLEKTDFKSIVDVLTRV
jgi:hypothetical protein